MSKTLTCFSTVINGSACIFDYLQLTGAVSPLIQFISAYIMQVKHWRFTEMEKIRFNSTGEKVYCEFFFQDGTGKSFEVMQDEHSQFFVKE